MAHTPPPQDLIPNQPPPPPAPQTVKEVRASSRQSISPRPSSVTGDAFANTCITYPAAENSSVSDFRQTQFPMDFKRLSGGESISFDTLGSSAPISGGFMGGGLCHPSEIYSGSASLGSLYNCPNPPPVPPPPLENLAFREPQHRRDASVNSAHSLNSFREFYDKTSLNQFISTSPKLSNRFVLNSSIEKLIEYLFSTC